MAFRRYGDTGPEVVLLHGGPGAPGSLNSLARSLETECRVIEHLQPTYAEGGRTLRDQIDGLDRDLEELGLERPHLVGWSWGAMLALCYAAERPRPVAQLVLIGSGTFDVESRAELLRRREERRTPELQARIAALKERLESGDPAMVHAAFGEYGRLMTHLDAVDPISAGASETTDVFDHAGNQSVWSDMLRLQREGVYPALFAQIDVPVAMLHGAEDTHPGRLIHANLRSLIPHLTYTEFEACGHQPWLERRAREPFFTTLRELLKT